MTEVVVQGRGAPGGRGLLAEWRAAAGQAVGIASASAVMVLGVAVIPEVMPEEVTGRVQVTETATAPGTDRMAHLPAVALAAAVAYAGCAVRISRARRVV
ncbi:hypothetical protein OG730_09925 [Streptomyces sp. NBC_01298]|uniref:hypothetical protein n=1 Tax=Streptomyces sp. NBC_01298 TaxID=2903817 RepID=UPI002E10E6DD|nr:hypothetical protein OG730_09925 [Streptomyces sp. NBC_01298]